MNHFEIKANTQVLEAISKLPTADQHELYTTAGAVTGFKGIRVLDYNGQILEFVNCPRTSYQIVQHAQAFQPVIEGLWEAGLKDNYEAVFETTTKYAKMNILVGGEGYDSVKLGFSVTNSYDGSGAINYGFRMDRNRKYVELVGYRQICSNGMKIRVPLNNAEIIRPELKTKIETLFSQITRIRHTKGAVSRLEEIKSSVEAVTLMKEPVELMIKNLQTIQVNDQQLELLIKKFVGKRFKLKVINAFNEGNDHSTWGFYNAMTWVASHDETIKPTARQTLLDKAEGVLYAYNTA